MRSPRRGFTFWEFVVTILVMGVLACVLYAFLAYFKPFGYDPAKLFARHGELVEVGRVKLFFKEPVTKVEATKVALWLMENELKDDPRESKVAFQLLRDGKLYQLKGAWRDGVEIDDDRKSHFKQLARNVSNLLGGSEVELHVCDSELNTKSIYSMAQETPAIK